LNDVTISLYQKKLVINREDEYLARHIIKYLVPIKKHGGSDEAGKGDIFGPLVVAGVVLEDQLHMRLAIDGKELSNKAVKKLGEYFLTHALVKTSQVEPKALVGNMNKILLGLHTQVYDMLMPIKPFYVDDFGARSELLKHGAIPLYRGEVLPAVAAASIVSRAIFLDWLEQNGLPAGSSKETQEKAEQIALQAGCSELKRVAKANFSLVKRLCS
jgi:ribonuclease HIII